MDFHRNVYGKSRLKCFSVPEFLGSVDVDVEVLMAGQKSNVCCLNVRWYWFHAMPAIEIVHVLVDAGRF